MSATVFGSDNQAVTWKVIGGTTVGGQFRATVDADGVFTASYPGQYLVQATSVANSGAFGQAVILVKGSVDPILGVPTALQNRVNYSVTALSNGKILLAGGWDGTAYHGDSYLYDSTAQTFAKTTGDLLQPRAGHQAMTLQDGRVLILGGEGVYDSPVNPGGPAPTEKQIPWAEVFDPVTSTFQALPVNSRPGGASFAGQMRDAHPGGSPVLLKDGRVAVLGGWAGYYYNGYNQVRDLFDPVAGTFELAAPFSSLPLLPAFLTATTLDDGRVLITGGKVQNIPPGQTTGPFVPSARTQLYDPATETYTPAPDLTDPRLGHTATKLPDGRILLIGGTNRMDSPSTLGAPQQAYTTTKCEIYDPKTGLYIPTGPMTWPRSDHAAILLPTGQVLVVGGWTSMTLNADGSSNYLYPFETEMFDPDAGTWRVEDNLGYGLNGPKLAPKSDGGVFVAGMPIPPSVPGTVASAMTAPRSSSVQSRLAPTTAGGLSSGLIWSICGAITPVKLDVDFVTINQGVERFIDNDNRQSKMSAWRDMPWKAGVPIIQERSGIFRVYLKDNGYTGKTKFKIRMEVNGNLYQSDRIISIDPKKPNNRESFWTLEGSMATFDQFGSNLLNGSGHIRVLSDPATNKEKILLETDLTLKKSLPITINVAKGYYIWTDQYGGKHYDTINIADVILKIQSEIAALFPISYSDVNIKMIDAALFNQNDWTSATTWDKNIEGLLTNEGYPKIIERWNNLITQKYGTKPERQYYILLLPLIFKDAYDYRGMTAGDNHCSVVSIPVDGSAERSDTYVISHELGHQHGILHPDSPLTEDYFRTLYNIPPGKNLWDIWSVKDQFDWSFPGRLTEYGRNLPNVGTTGQIGVRGYDSTSHSSSMDMQPYRPKPDSLDTIWYDFMAYERNTWISDYNYYRLFKYNNPN